MKRKLPSGVTAETTPPNSKVELGFVPDSLGHIALTIEYIGYRDKLDQAFQAAIARAKGGLNSCFKHE